MKFLTLHKLPSLLIFIMASVAFNSYLSIAQESKKELLSKTWKYKGIEEFSVISAPDSLQKNDFIELKNDGTYLWVKKGAKSSGSWSLNEKSSTITFIDSKSKKSLTYNLKKVDHETLVIEYQTPDLVRTKYHYVLSKQQ